jgi:hypothetical protein
MIIITAQYQVSASSVQLNQRDVFFIQFIKN